MPQDRISAAQHDQYLDSYEDVMLQLRSFAFVMRIEAQSERNDASTKQSARNVVRDLEALLAKIEGR